METLVNERNKEETTMKKRILTLAMALALVLTAFASTALAVETMYLYAPSGKTVNVRSEPSTAGGNATVLQMTPIGTAVQVEEYLSNGWAAIIWGSYGTAYVKTEFLSSVQRGPSGGGVTPVTPSTDKEKAMNSLAAELSSFKQVTSSYTIYPMPRRASGFVNFRLAPVQYGKEYYRVYANNALTVLGETKGWYQVRDENTGVVGYIVKSLTTLAP